MWMLRLEVIFLLWSINEYKEHFCGIRNNNIKVLAGGASYLQMSLDLLALSTEWEVNGKTKRCITHHQCQKNLFIKNGSRIWNLFDLVMGTKSSGWSCGFCNVCGDVIILWITLCPLKLLFISKVNPFEGLLGFLSLLALKYLTLLYPDSCPVKTDN